jgi:hypothetical protein
MSEQREDPETNLGKFDSIFFGVETVLQSGLLSAKMAATALVPWANRVADINRVTRQSA